MSPRISIEQWQALVAVVDAGSYAAAAEQLHKTQSTLSYAVKKLETMLGVKVFARSGRRSVLTPAGEALVRRARMLLEEAVLLERGAVALAAGSLPELRLAVDTIFPTWLLLNCLEEFAERRPETRIELYETVLDGTEELLREGRVDLAIGWRVPAGLIGDPLVRLRFVMVAHPSHPLHQLQRPVDARDLRRHRHLVIRDSASTRSASGGALTVGPRWTLSSKATSIRAACMGLGFASYPQESVRSELEQGLLKALPLAEGAERFGELHLIYADRDLANADVRYLAELVRKRAKAGCMEAIGAA